MQRKTVLMLKNNCNRKRIKNNILIKLDFTKIFVLLSFLRARAIKRNQTPLNFFLTNISLQQIPIRIKHDGLNFVVFEIKNITLYFA